MTARMPTPGAHGAQTLPTLAETPQGVSSPFRDMFGHSEVGHVRKANEDHFLMVDIERTLHVHGSSLGAQGLLRATCGSLLVVADGMGGHDNGELASAIAIDTIASYAAGALPIDPSSAEESKRSHDGFQAAALECQRRINQAALRKGCSPKLGTTLTVLYAQGNAAEIAHVGDSRAYLVRPGSGCWRLTHDHTLGAAIEEKTGKPAPGVAHVLTNSIGANEEKPHVEALHVPLQANDRVLLCSDGLTDNVDDATIGAEVARASSAREAVMQLCERVLAGEARDNLTVVVAIA